ncbi:hypothetical protein CWE09_11120 [Aliidiomarina minuta]|uniref:GNAT family N-acetyltransferase n=1 Tax=Aliidiomarina minuta TaxID=880057 RepID=A0A432W4J1_9GAMM|nr:hypothetical protein [Aliidiomarina minuta]RUO24408.1 hypothetical protein CWE09_11120 [Aliidiomarina minuta]
MRLLLMTSVTLLIFWQNPLAASWQDIQPADSYHNVWSIEPLQERHSYAYYSAYQSSQSMLESTLGWGWPTAKISREMNQDTVQYHREQHVNGATYSYIIRDSEHEQIMGAVFVAPVQNRRGLPDFDGSSYQAEVTFWMNEAGQEHEQGPDFVADLLLWLEENWGFSRVLLPAYEDNDFARQQFEAHNLGLVIRDPESQELLYRFRAR